MSPSSAASNNTWKQLFSRSLLFLERLLLPPRFLWEETLSNGSDIIKCNWCPLKTCRDGFLKRFLFFFNENSFRSEQDLAHFDSLSVEKKKKLYSNLGRSCEIVKFGRARMEKKEEIGVVKGSRPDDFCDLGGRK